MIRLEQFTKYFHKGSINEVLAIDDISLNIKPGDFITVIGSNGAGKSTLLNGIAGGFRPEKGNILIQDKDVTDWPEYKRAKFISRVFQDPLKGTCASATIEQNMALAKKRGLRRGFSRGVKPADRDFFRSELEKLGLGLENRLKDKAGLLSGGQRQAMTMLMATMVQPDVLLLDEHTAALDPKTAHEVLELTQSIIENEKLTTLMVTHQMNQALKLGNRLVMMHKGKIILDVDGDEKQNLTVDDLLDRFFTLQGEELASDKMLLETNR